MLDKQYTPRTIEERWYRHWETSGYFKPNGDGSCYCILLPPPNVTGHLHMGHAFQHTLMDILTRFHRMRGYRVLWQGGTDHAGIATQLVVERQLASEHISRGDLGREAFVKRVWEWKERSGSDISRQMRRLGISLDWSRERFTMDSDMSTAVEKVFISLYDEGLIYRGKRLVNWDPALATAISDLEVVSEEEAGSLWHISYPLSDGSGMIEVATTRPETILGDVAVAVHPEDERYQCLIGKALTLPLVGRTIPIIADSYVDPKFGTGCVKITPAHDFNDYIVGKRHRLEPINIFTRTMLLNDAVPEAYRGLSREEARQRVVADLDAAGRLVRVEPHRMMVPHSDRSGAVVEPYLTDQWFVRVEPLAAEAIEAVADGRIRFVPDSWNKTYFEWMRNIEDWCISRQLWWGHRIPAWYDAEKNIYVGESLVAIRKKYHLDESVVLTQDEDVLDTWFSSALWPFSTLGWPKNSEILKAFYPSTVLVTGFDIIFFWVARMIMMGLKFMKKVPFHAIYIHGLVRDSEGKKMSKSRGNVIDPIDLIDGITLPCLVAKRTTALMRSQDAERITRITRQEYPDGIEAYGTDALRFTFAILAAYGGRDISFDTGRIGGSRAFCNKLWNATRFVLMSISRHQVAPSIQPEYGLAEQWIRGEFSRLCTSSTQAIESYRFGLAAQRLYSFTWDKYCDWYLELAKITLTDDDARPEVIAGTIDTLQSVLEGLVRLLHPFIPFITEEIWQRLTTARPSSADSDSIMNQSWPDAMAFSTEQPSVARQFDWLCNVVKGVRGIRAEHNLPPGRGLSVLLHKGNQEEWQWINTMEREIKGLAKLVSMEKSNSTPTEHMAVTVVGDMEILVPLSQLIDPVAERNRLMREIEKLQITLGRCEKKLSDNNFLNRAPDAVIAQERERQREASDVLIRLQKHLEKLGH